MMKSTHTYKYILMLLLATALLYSCNSRNSEDTALKENASAHTDSSAGIGEDVVVPDSLTREELKGYMEIGSQKLKDYADYMSIALDLNYKDEFRKQAEAQAMDHFIEPAKEEGDKQWIWPDSLRNKFRGHQVKIVIDSIRTAEFPTVDTVNVYRGTLTFRQTITGKQMTKSASTITMVNRYSADVLIIRKEKQFGNETREVWEVMFDSFGELK